MAWLTEVTGEGRIEKAGVFDQAGDASLEAEAAGEEVDPPDLDVVLLLHDQAGSTGLRGDPADGRIRAVG